MMLADLEADEIHGSGHVWISFLHHSRITFIRKTSEVGGIRVKEGRKKDHQLIWNSDSECIILETSPDDPTLMEMTTD